jgi:hypothetical protein
MTMSDAPTIPGVSAQTEAVLRMVVREEVAAGIKAGLADPICPRPCDRVEGVETVVYGNGAPGLKGRVGTLEEQVGNLVWLSRTAIGTAVASGVAAVLSVILG